MAKVTLRRPRALALARRAEPDHAPWQDQSRAKRSDAIIIKTPIKRDAILA
jgi:hypothetical protein